MRNLLWLSSAAFFLAACEGDALFVMPTPPPVEHPDASEPEPAPDASVHDGGIPDSGVEEPPPADEKVYIHTGEELFAYDPDSNSTTRIGRFSNERGPLEVEIVDIAIDLDGRMFGGTRRDGPEDDEPNEVYQIDPETGRCTFRFRFADTMHGLTFLSNGNLVVAGRRISVINPRTGALIRDYPEAADRFETSGDIVGLPDGFLYWTVRGERRQNGAWGSDRVVRINPQDGELHVIGDARVDRIYGLGYADDELFGFSSAGIVVTLDPNTGEFLQQRTLAGRWFGATTNPVRW